MLRFISKLNDDLKDQLFILCSATSRYLATITAQLMLRNVVSNSFVTPEGRMSRLGGWPNSFFKLFRQKFDNRRADQNLSAAACRIHQRRRRTGGGAHVCDLQRLEIGGTNGRRHKGTSGGNRCGASGALVGNDTWVLVRGMGRGYWVTSGRRHMGTTGRGRVGAGLQGH